MTVPYIRNLYEGLSRIMGENAIFPGTVKFYQEYVSARYAEGWRPGMMAEPEVPEQMLREARAFSDIAVISLSRFSGEGWDRKSPWARVVRKEPVIGDTVNVKTSFTSAAGPPDQRSVQQTSL